MRILHLLVPLLFAAGGASSSCANPVHSDAVDAQGGEAPGVREGPTHRPGQPCLVCHGGDGPGPDFSFGGTIYATRAGKEALPGVTVVLRDATGTERRETTNEVGNFYITKDTWSPTMPVLVRLEYTPRGQKTITSEMVSRVGGNGGCAYCHFDPDNTATHMPHVYMSEK
jgi:hypothetical protein